MKVDDMGRACHLMKIVHILRDHRYLILFLQLRYEAVTVIGLCLHQFLTQHVIEIIHIHRIRLPSFMSRHTTHWVVLPQAIGITESAQSALHRHTRACQHYDLLHILGF